MATVLTDVKRTAADKKKEDAPYEESDYPYGLELTLDTPTVDKLGLGAVEVSQEVRVNAKAFVSSYRSDQRNGKDERRVSLQITELAVMQSGDDADAAKTMYEE